MSWPIKARTRRIEKCAMGRAVKRTALLPVVGVHKPADESPNSAFSFTVELLPLFAEMFGRFCLNRARILP
jgi:hypothetical protein